MGSNADAEAVAALLENIRKLRLTLTADLAAAAGALDADQPTIARDIIAADRLEVAQLCAGDCAPTPIERSRRRRALLMLPAIPLVGALAMTGAAALSGSFTTHHHDVARPVAATSSRRTAARPAPQSSDSAATSTLHRLERVIRGNSGQAQVVAVANQLHHQLTAIIDLSSGSPKRLGEVQHLLTEEQQLLEQHSGDGSAIALAASRELTQLLNLNGLPSVLQSPTTIIAATPPPSTAPTPVTTSPTPHHSPSPSSSSPPTSPTPTHSSHHHRRHHHRRRRTNPLLVAGLIEVEL